jgi:hypothetical protein
LCLEEDILWGGGRGGEGLTGGTSACESSPCFHRLIFFARPHYDWEEGREGRRRRSKDKQWEHRRGDLAGEGREEISKGGVLRTSGLQGYRGRKEAREGKKGGGGSPNIIHFTFHHPDLGKGTGQV